MKKREIQLSRKNIKTLIFLLVLLILLPAGGLLLIRRPALLSGLLTWFSGAPTAKPAEQPDALTAEAIVSTFYTLDYAEPSEAWQARVCALATADGCQLFQGLYAPLLRPVVEEEQIQTGCTAQAVQMVEDDGDSRIWLVEAALDHSWEGADPSMPVYVQIVQENGAWLLGHILLDVEAARFVTPSPVQ